MRQIILLAVVWLAAACFSLCESLAESKTYQVLPQMCDFDVPERLTEAECDGRGGMVLFAGRTKVCRFDSPKSEFVGIDELVKYQRSFVELLPLGFVDSIYPNHKIKLSYFSDKLDESSEGSHISGEAIVDSPAESTDEPKLSYSWTLANMQLEVLRCIPRDKESFDCCKIYFYLQSNADRKVLIHGKELGEDLRYLGRQNFSDLFHAESKARKLFERRSR